MKDQSTQSMNINGVLLFYLTVYASVLDLIFQEAILLSIPISVTRLGNLLHFGQLFKAYGNNYFVQIAHISRQFFKAVKIFHFSS